jgi:hypothetical protein
MEIARAHLVDPAVSRWYHCITRCVGLAFLLGDETQNRKSWIEHRLQELVDIFAISVGGFSVLDNHPHRLVRLDPALGQAWTDEEVVRRWARLFPPRDKFLRGDARSAPVGCEAVRRAPQGQPVRLPGGLRVCPLSSRIRENSGPEAAEFSRIRLPRPLSGQTVNR